MFHYSKRIRADKFEGMNTRTAIGFDMGATTTKTGVVRDGKIIYGNKGALEGYVGHYQISARAKEIYKEAGKNLSDAEAQPDHLIKAAKAGDQLADQVWADIGLKIGIGLVNVIWLVNPDRIVIGGGVANAGERLFGYIRQAVRARCEETFWKKLEIVPATLHNDAGIIGPAMLALESEFQQVV